MTLRPDPYSSPFLHPRRALQRGSWATAVLAALGVCLSLGLVGCSALGSALGSGAADGALESLERRLQAAIGDEVSVQLDEAAADGLTREEVAAWAKAAALDVGKDAALEGLRATVAELRSQLAAGEGVDKAELARVFAAAAGNEAKDGAAASLEELLLGAGGLTGLLALVWRLAGSSGEKRGAKEAKADLAKAGAKAEG